MSVQAEELPSQLLKKKKKNEQESPQRSHLYQSNKLGKSKNMAANIVQQLSPSLTLFLFIYLPDLVQKSPFNMHALCPLQDATWQHRWD